MSSHEFVFRRKPHGDWHIAYELLCGPTAFLSLVLRFPVVDVYLPDGSLFRLKKSVWRTRYRNEDGTVFSGLVPTLFRDVLQVEGERYTFQLSKNGGPLDGFSSIDCSVMHADAAVLKMVLHKLSASSPGSRREMVLSGYLHCEIADPKIISGLILGFHDFFELPESH